MKLEQTSSVEFRGNFVVGRNEIIDVGTSVASLELMRSFSRCLRRFHWHRRAQSVHHCGNDMLKHGSLIAIFFLFRRYRHASMPTRLPGKTPLVPFLLQNVKDNFPFFGGIVGGQEVRWKEMGDICAVRKEPDPTVAILGRCSLYYCWQYRICRSTMQRQVCREGLV